MPRMNLKTKRQSNRYLVQSFKANLRLAWKLYNILIWRGVLIPKKSANVLKVMEADYEIKQKGRLESQTGM